MVFFLLTSYFSTTSGNQYVTNGPLLKLKLETYKKSSVYFNGSNDDETSKYKKIYKQLVLDSGSLPFDVENVETGELYIF